MSLCVCNALDESIRIENHSSNAQAHHRINEKESKQKKNETKQWCESDDEQQAEKSSVA